MVNIITPELVVAWAIVDFVASVYYLSSRKEKKIFVLPALAAAAIISGGMGLAQAGLGYAQKMKAAKLARNNPTQKLNDDPYLDDQYALTASYAQQGLSDGTKQLLTSTVDRNLSGSITDVLRAGGSINNIADLYEGSQNVLRQVALEEERAKMRNIESFIQNGTQVKANENRDQFMINKWVPQRDTAQMIAELSKQGMDNIFKGLDTAGGSAIKFLDGNAK